MDKEEQTTEEEPIQEMAKEDQMLEEKPFHEVACEILLGVRDKGLEALGNPQSYEEGIQMLGCCLLYSHIPPKSAKDVVQAILEQAKEDEFAGEDYIATIMAHVIIKLDGVGMAMTALVDDEEPDPDTDLGKLQQKIKDLMVYEEKEAAA